MNSIYKLDMSQAGKISLVDIVGNHIRNLIFSGTLKDGDEIPTVRDLAEKWPVSYVVIQKALVKCSEEGLLLRSTGRKCVVRNAAAENRKIGCVYFVIEQTVEESRTSDISNASYFMGFMNGLQFAMAPVGVAVNAFGVSDIVQQKNFIERLKRYPADIVVLMRSKSSDFVNDINKTGTSLVLIEPHVFNPSGIIVQHDEAGAAEDMISAFVGSACEKLALIYFDDGKWITSRRIEAISAKIKSSKLSLPDDWLIKLDSRELPAVASVLKKLTDKSFKPDGLVILNIDHHKIIKSLELAGHSGEDVKVGIYTDDVNPDSVSFAVIIDSYKFGVNTGEFLNNSFYKKQIKGKDRTLILPYEFKKI